MNKMKIVCRGFTVADSINSGKSVGHFGSRISCLLVLLLSPHPHCNDIFARNAHPLAFKDIVRLEYHVC